MRKRNRDGVEFPEYPEIPQNEEELEAQIQEMADEDQDAELILKNAEKAAELNSQHCNFTQKIACLQLVRGELFHANMRLWEAVFAANKMIKALEAAVGSADNIVTGLTDNIVRAQQTPVPVKVVIKEADVKVLNNQRDEWVKGQQNFLNDLKTDSGKAVNAVWQIMRDGQGFWVQGSYVKWLVLTFLICLCCTLCCMVVGAAMLYNWIDS